MKEAVLLDQVFFSFDGNPVLQAATAIVREGECIGIIGPNGSGKTTLLRLLMGFIGPEKGKVQVFGSDPKKSERRIGYVPQALSYDRSFPISIGELVLSGTLSSLTRFGRYTSEAKEKARVIMEKLLITHLKDRPLGSVSGGQAQRAFIARALAAEPELLLLDEPTANIDRETQKTIYELLASLRETITIMMVTHDLDTVMNDVDRVFCMQGNILSLRPSEVCKHYTMGLYHKPLVEPS